MKQALYLLISLLIPVVSIYAQSGSTDSELKQNNVSNRKFDQLFNQIVQTIPEKGTGLHDSVSQQSRSERQRPDVVVSPEKMRDRRDQMTRELPEDLRKQVERAIEQIDLKKVEHVPSFIENRSTSK